MATYTPQPVGQFQGAGNGQTPTGETPLATLPQYGGAGGGQQAAEYYAARDFAAQFGRNPTQSELSMLAPGYLGTDPNIANLSGGKGQIAAYYQQQSQSPQNIYQQQQKQVQDQAPQYADKVNQVFQQNYGRDATDAEKAHFGALMAGGQDPYQVQQALQQTTEYNTKQTQDFTKNLGSQLQGVNADYFSKYLLPAIQAQNAQAGRTQDSSGYQAQVVNAGQQQNYDLQNYLAGVSATGYQGSVENNAKNYQGLLGQQYGLQNAGVSNTLANNAANTQYGQNLNLYQMQQDSYNRYLQRYGKRGGNTYGGALTGAIGGAGVGAKFGPWGALLGGLGGGALGGFGGSQQQGY